MSEQTSTPSDDESTGTFDGGTFGRTEDASKDAPPADRDPQPGEPSYLLDAGAGPAGATRDVETDAETDVEGTSTEPSPGERNEPV